MHKTFDELGFKVGDEIKCTKSNFHAYVVGEIYTIEKDKSSGHLSIKGCYNGMDGDWELVKDEDMYEDGWILNDGKVTIPDDAQKSMHEGSVVAFRKRKPVVFNFGDRIKAGLNEYIFVKYQGYDKDRCIVAHESGVYEDQHVSLFTKV